MRLQWWDGAAWTGQFSDLPGLPALLLILGRIRR
ncbi:hypothetical protein [Paenarthrobacter ilicis]|nr:hypothetical protein [Paenarthrobacter ilicis]